MVLWPVRAGSEALLSDLPVSAANRFAIRIPSRSGESLTVGDAARILLVRTRQRGDACGTGESLHRALSAGNSQLVSDSFERCQRLAPFGPQSFGGWQREASQQRTDVA